MRPLRRTSLRAVSRPAVPPESSGLSLPVVLGALLRGQPELTLLAKAAVDVARLELVDDRFALMSTILAAHPAAVVLPPFDADDTSTAPLVLRVRREAPDVAVLLLSGQPGGAGQPMLRAAQAGAHVITSPTIRELRNALLALLAPEAAGQ